MKAKMLHFVSHPQVSLVFRLILGGIFVASGIAKLFNRIEFIVVLGSYGLIPQGLVESFSFILPWAELVIGCLLLLGLFSRITSIAAVALLTSFVTANIYVMSSGNGSGSSLCGCFGEMIPLNHTGSLILGSLMLLMATRLVFVDTGLRSTTPYIGGWATFSTRLAGFRYAVPLLLVGILLAFSVVPSVVSSAASIDASGMREIVPNVGSGLDSEIDASSVKIKPSFLSFYLERCPSCQQEKQIIDELETEYAEKITFVPIDIASDHQAAGEFGVTRVPTMVLTSSLNWGEQYEYKRFEGFTGKKELKRNFDDCLRQVSSMPSLIISTDTSSTDDVVPNIYVSDMLASGSEAPQQGASTSPAATDIPQDMAHYTAADDTVLSDAQAAAQILKDAGRSAAEVGLALRDDFNLDDQDAAQILKDVGYSAVEVGQALKDVFGLSAADAAEIMKDVGYDDEEVDRVVRYPKDVAQEFKDDGVSSVEVGLVLRDEFLLGAQAAAQILKDVEYSAVDVGQVLKDAFELEARYAAKIMNSISYSAQETYEVLTSASAFDIDIAQQIEIEGILQYAGYEPEEFLDITAFETVKEFTPILWFDKAYWGLPMSAQDYFETVMNYLPPVTSSGTITWTTPWDGPCGAPGVVCLGGRDECTCGMANGDFDTLRNGEVPTYYQVISEPGGRLRIVYWWFYGFQGPCNLIPEGKDGAHHGDWEHIVVTTSEDRQQVDAVTYSFHGNWYTRQTDALEGDRPRAYVGKIAHGNYHNSPSCISCYGDLGNPLNCYEYADCRNPAHPGTHWDNANDNLVSLGLNSELWMLADRIGSTYEYDSREYTISHWRWGPHIDYCNVWLPVIGCVDWEHSWAIGTHPTVDSPDWSMPSCYGHGCSTDRSYFPCTEDLDYNEGWPPIVFPPGRPYIISPSDGEKDVILNPTLRSSDFNDLWGTHFASQWQVTTSAGNYSSPVFDSGTDTSNLTSIDLILGVLDYATTYNWHVRHQDNDGNWSAWSFEESFTTEEQLQAKFTANKTEGVAPLDVYFVDQSTGIYYSYLWEFGDGKTSDDQDCLHTYDEPGIYTVSLTISDPTRGTDTKTKDDYITVYERAIADFTAEPVIGEAPHTVQFRDRSTGDMDEWRWKFGDGETSTSRSPSHTYQSEGIYTVTLSVSGKGGDDTKAMRDYVIVEAPAGYAEVVIRDLNISPTYAQPRQEIQITASVANEGGTWGNRTVQLLINGALEQSIGVGVSPGTTQQVNFTIYRTEPGEYQVRIGNATGTFYILEKETQPAQNLGPLDFGGELDTGGIIAIVCIGIIIFGGIFVALLLTRRT